MKKSLRFTLIAAVAVSMTGMVFAATPNADALAEAKGIDADETGAYFDFSTAEIKGWNLDGGKKYITQNDNWAKFQDQSGNECTKVATLVDTGDGDKALSIDLGIDKGTNKSLLFNYSNQGKNAKDVSQAVFKARIYIPAGMVADGKANYPSILFVVRDGNWNMFKLGGDIDNVTVKQIGAGWHTLVIDFKNNTYDFGNVKGTIKTPTRVAQHSFCLDMTFYSKKLDADQATETFLIDWVRFDGIK